MGCTTVFLALAAVSAAAPPTSAAVFWSRFVGAPSAAGAPGAVGQGPAWGYPGSFGSASFAYPGAGGANAPVMGMPSEPSCPPTNGMVPLYVPDPDDCTKYTVCSGGFGMKLDCPPGLHFNKHENHCDFPPNARCEEATPSDEDPITLAATSGVKKNPPFNWNQLSNPGFPFFFGNLNPGIGQAKNAPGVSQAPAA